MTEVSEEMKTGMLESKFWRTILVVVAALLIFVGPTYMVHVLILNLGVDYWASMVTGIVVFIVGIAFLWYLFRKEIVT